MRIRVTSLLILEVNVIVIRMKMTNSIREKSNRSDQ